MALEQKSYISELYINWYITYEKITLFPAHTLESGGRRLQGPLLHVLGRSVCCDLPEPGRMVAAFVVEPQVRHISPPQADQRPRVRVERVLTCRVLRFFEFSFFVWFFGITFKMKPNVASGFVGHLKCFSGVRYCLRNNMKSQEHISNKIKM